jgi:hypothetical protein
LHTIGSGKGALRAELDADSVAQVHANSQTAVSSLSNAAAQMEGKPMLVEGPLWALSQFADS